MLFNSYTFLFGYLPTVLLGYAVAARWHRRAVVLWLALSSLAFYAFWRPKYLILLCASILFNYLAGALISRRIANSISPRLLLWLAICGNLAALCYFKYLFPLLNFVSSAQRSPLHWQDVVLPLGISFFTFTQIAYLVDLEQGAARQQDLASYSLFVTFFPHLIAGPILHHAEIMPQFQARRDYRLRAPDLAVGLSWFIMGLFKKVLLADKIAPAADAAFAAPGSLHAFSAWVGVLAYALQLYFDFSGYSDMAIGLARMFSIDFPLNFSSPYKATSIIDFWQRWHMTLTRYIMSYIYNPISIWINRRRIARGKKISRKATATVEGFLELVAFPTTVTLFLAGVWHGAGFQFLIFGLLHALYLCINHAWRVSHGSTRKPAQQNQVAALAASLGSLLLTFFAVLIAQIFFRAAGTAAALSMLAAMFGLHGQSASALQTYTPSAGSLALLVLGYLIVWGLPNTQQILSRYLPSMELTKADRENESAVRIHWTPGIAWGLGLGLVFFVILVKMQDPTTFLYFQF